MTVKELIAHLQTMPPEFMVIYRQCSCWSVLDAEDVDVVTKDQKKLAWHHNYPDTVVDHNPRINRGGIETKFVDAVTFPGN